jgi:hypothetical protein
MMDNKHILEDLGGNLILRRSTSEDAEALGKFNGLIHADPGEGFAEHVATWVKDLLSGRHPTFHPDDFTLVENTATGEIVSCLCLIDQTWAYEGIPFGVGRPELVGTLADFRRRGLVRKQFEVIHRLSAERGHMAQIITGIPWYYRQFGYEMAVNLGGGRVVYLPGIPSLKQDEEEPFAYRDAAEKDLHFITELYNHSTKRSLLSGVRDEAIWRYNLFVRMPTSDMAIRMQIIENHAGEPVGYFTYRPTLRGGQLSILSFELIPGISWLLATPSLLRRAQSLGEQFAEEASSGDEQVSLHSISLHLGEDHPSFHVAPRSMPLVRGLYAYYMRVPDLPGFIRMIGPVLEERLSQSYAVGYSGELRLNFFTDGLNLIFEGGKLKSVEGWDQPDEEQASVHFPDLTFLQLLFGYRSYDEINAAYADCYAYKNEAEVLLRILFPKKPSRVYDLA